METLLNIGLWAIGLLYLTTVHIFFLATIATILKLPIEFLKINRWIVSYTLACTLASIILYSAYNYIWILTYDEQAPIIFYIMGLVAVWLGSGGDKVKLNFAAQNMQAGQVFAILICMFVALTKGAAFFH